MLHFVNVTAPQLVSTCPVCRSSKTLRVEGSEPRHPMLFCGKCGHLWPGTEPVPSKNAASTIGDS